MDQRLQGSTAIVTGGGRGIGAAAARAMAREGAAVGLIARTASEIETVADELREAGARAWAAVADVSDLDALQGAVTAIEHELGPTDVLISNAGISGGRPAPAWDIDPTEWWRTQEVNVLGALHAVHAVVPGMVARGRGRVIHVGSLMGARSVPGSSAYACSKASLLRLSEVLAADLEGTGVVSIAMSPGLVLTQMTEPMKRRRDLPDEAWTDIDRGADLMVRLAAGDADALAGTMVHAEDDLDALVARAEEIRTRGWYALRMIRGLEEARRTSPCMLRASDETWAPHPRCAERRQEARRTSRASARIFGPRIGDNDSVVTSATDRPRASSSSSANAR
jgi:NADP-dependent 3-hydroxy acid dehydrogenase YdfG